MAFQPDVSSDRGCELSVLSTATTTIEQFELDSISNALELGKNLMLLDLRRRTLMN
jgi:hypothetical protein